MAWDLTRDVEVYNTAALEGAPSEKRLFAGSLEAMIDFVRAETRSDQALLAIRLVPDAKNEAPIYGPRISELLAML